MYKYNSNSHYHDKNAQSWQQNFKDNYNGKKPMTTIAYHNFCTSLIVGILTLNQYIKYPGYKITRLIIKQTCTSLNHSQENSALSYSLIIQGTKYLSIIIDSRPTNCGCSPFHPTIGLDAFTLSILATPVPSHDTTRKSLSGSQ
jgi:hypothetical protein